MKRHKLQNNKGFVLVHLIISIFLLVSVLIFLINAVNQYQKGVHRNITEIEKRAEHRSKAYQAVALIFQDDPKVDDLSEPWNRLGKENSFEKDDIHVDITDETGKLNLKFITHQDIEVRKRYTRFIERLLENLRVPSFLSRKILESSASIESLEEINQLTAVAEVKEKIDIDLGLYLTVHSQGKININTASREVLEVLLEEDHPFLVKEILKNRERSPFKAVGQLKGVQQDVLRFITVKSSHFRIETSESPSKEPKVSMIVQRSLGELKIQQWIEK